MKLIKTTIQSIIVSPIIVTSLVYLFKGYAWVGQKLGFQEFIWPNGDKGDYAVVFAVACMFVSLIMLSGIMSTSSEE